MSFIIVFCVNLVVIEVVVVGVAIAIATSGEYVSMHSTRYGETFMR